ncbi:LITAF domain-containing protein [Condylostylus longicornis]|uniref:LITAF domain-containing protein n=1 Tax=Condylostylus longicornis TaxID=2530218 RepID=UPI00244E49EA|nr:LITAF domain-containing protein [Condylostylus longicornis]XP_055378825.1 LITAF domain-containing protein [Condylostylus longicornis]XP_055378826.1 LITAF domain-containing protein [Condylostylus longicornis]
MSKTGSSGPPTAPPQYTYVTPPQAPPSYQEAVGGVKPVGQFTPVAPVNQNLVTTVVPIARNSTHMICPHCHAEINTSTRTEPGLIAYLSGFVIALLGCWLGCCLIPCCIDDCMDVHHTCPNCKAYLGRYRR